MDPFRQDSDLAVELVPLLGRELKAARKRIQELEQAGLRQNSHTSSASLDSERAVTADATNATLRANIASLKAENSKLRRDLSSAEEIKPDAQSFNSHDREQLLQLSEELNQRELAAQQHVAQIETLDGELTTLRDKYKRQREEKRKLRQTRDELSIQLANPKDEKDPLAQRLYVSREVPPSQVFETLQNYKSFMSALQHIYTRPKYSQLKPLYRMTTHLSYNDVMTELIQFCCGGRELNSEWFSDGVLFFPGRTIWCPTSRQHALALGSRYQFDKKEQCWTEKSDLTWIKKPTHDLFYTYEKFVYYAGTYKCHQLPDLTPKVTAELDPELFNTIIAESIGNQGKKHNIHRSTISKLYSDGILKIECLGLQCVGFNFGIYNALLQQMSVDVRNKRKADEDNNGQPMKRKVVGQKHEQGGKKKEHKK